MQPPLLCDRQGRIVPQSNQIAVKKNGQIRILKDTESSPCRSGIGAKRNKTRLSDTKNCVRGSWVGNVS